MPWDLYHEKKSPKQPSYLRIRYFTLSCVDISDISLLCPSTTKERDFQLTVLSNNIFVSSAETKRVTCSIVIKM